MATAVPNANINIPYSAFLDPTTGRPSQPWLQWLMNPSVMSINLSSAVSVTSGGTGLTAIPTNGQLLIGNGTGYTLNTLGHGAGISVTNGLGTITVANTGVISFSAGTTGLTPSTATDGAIVLAGILNVANGGTGVSTATANTVFAGPTTGAAAAPSFRTLVAADITNLTNSAPVTKTADFSVAASDLWLINNKSGSTCTVTLPSASAYSGRILHFQNYQIQALVSASSNVVPIAGGAAGSSILVASSGDQATLVSDGSNWLMTQYIPNNILLLET